MQYGEGKLHLSGAGEVQIHTDSNAICDGQSLFSPDPSGPSVSIRLRRGPLRTGIRWERNVWKITERVECTDLSASGCDFLRLFSPYVCISVLIDTIVKVEGMIKDFGTLSRRVPVRGG